MNGNSDGSFGAVFVGLGFAALVLFLAWLFNRIWGPKRRSLWGRIWQIEKFLLSFIAAGFTICCIIHVIDFFLSASNKSMLKEIPSMREVAYLMLLSSVISMLALVGAAAFIVRLQAKQTRESGVNSMGNNK